MADFKTCPTCGAEVPAAAARCKDCFHDFNAVKPRNWGPIVLLGSIASMTVIGAITLVIIAMQPVDQRILVDEETQSIIVTTKYRTGPTTERIRFDQVGKIEHVQETDGAFNVVAVTLDGERRVLAHSGEESLIGDARKYANIMKKPLEEVDKTGVEKTAKH